MAGSAGCGARKRGPVRAQFLLEQLVERGAVRARTFRSTRPPRTSTRFRLRARSARPATPRSSTRSARSCAGMRWRWWCAPTRNPRSSAGISRALPRRRRCTTSGFNHFFRAANENFGGDLVYFQGHSAPGIYARAFLEGRITEEQLDHFRQEVGGKGLSSYPHPWLMPDFWQFPTVSMGLGPLMAIYQARFMRYLKDRGILEGQGRKVWAFMGDGEMDEPESLGAISLAGREKLDNLIFVINCNLQRLDGPVRGNGKIIQELEAGFPRRGLERDQGDLGLVLGPAHRARQERAAVEAHGGMRRRRIPGVQGERRRFRAQAFLRQISRAAGDGRQHVGRRHLAPESRRPRSAQGLRGLRGGDEAHRASPR